MIWIAEPRTFDLLLIETYNPVATVCGCKVMEVKLVHVLMVINLSSHNDVSYGPDLKIEKGKVIL